MLTAHAVHLTGIWHLIEEFTGLSIAQGRTLRECSEAAQAIKQPIIDRIYSGIPDAIAKYGSAQEAFLRSSLTC